MSTTTIHIAPNFTQTQTTTTTTEIKDPLISTQPLHQPFVEQPHIVEQRIPEAPLPLPTQEQGFTRTEHPFLGEGKDLSKTTGYKDEIVGGMKEIAGKMGNEKLRLEGQQQKLQGELQVEQSRLAKERHDLFVKNKKSLEGKFPDKHHQEILDGTTVFIHQDQPIGHQQGFVEPIGHQQGFVGEPISQPISQPIGHQQEFVGEGKSASTATGYKNELFGGIKEIAGKILGSEQMRLEGQQQKLHGEHEVEQAKRHDTFNKNKKTLEGKFPDKHHQEILAGTAVHQDFEHQPFQHQTEFEHEPLRTQTQPLSEVPLPLPDEQTWTEPLVEKDPSKVTGYKDQVVGGMKEIAGKMGSEQMRLQGEQQKLHGAQEVQQATLESQRHDLFTKNKKALEGKFPDQHHQEILDGTAVNKEFDYQSRLDGKHASQVTGYKDQFMGGMKGMTGSEPMRLEGEQQKLHGEQEVGQAKLESQRHDLFTKNKKALEAQFPDKHHQEILDGTAVNKEFDYQSQLDGKSASQATGYKDQVMGGMKELAGKMGGEQMRLEGEQQKLHGEQEVEQAKLASQRHDLFTKNKKALEGKFPDKHHQEILDGIDMNRPFVSHPAMFDPEPAVPVVKPIHDEPLPLPAYQQGFVGNQKEFPIPEDKNPSKTTGYKDEIVGGMKEIAGKMGSEQMRLDGQQQKLRGEEEVEQAKLAQERHDVFTKGKKSLEGKFPDKHHQEIIDGTAFTGQGISSTTGFSSTSTGFSSSSTIPQQPVAEAPLPLPSQHVMSSTSTIAQEPLVDTVPLSSQHIGRTEHPFVEGKHASKMSGYKDEVVGGMKQVVGKITSEKLRISGKQQKLQGAQEVEQAKLLKSRHNRFEEGKKGLEGQFPDKHHQQIISGTHLDSTLPSAPVASQTTGLSPRLQAPLGVSPRSNQLGVSPRSNQLNVLPRSNSLNTSPRHCVQQPLEKSPRHMAQV